MIMPDSVDNKDQVTEETTDSQKSAAADKGMSDDDQMKLVSALAYLGFLFFLPMIMFPKSKFAMFHANQGLILLIAGLIITVASPIILVVTLGLGAFLMPLVSLGMLILAIMGGVGAYRGEMKPLPIVGGFTILKVKEE